MPYDVRQDDRGRWCVYRGEDLLHCYDNREAAERYRRALYANVEDASVKVVKATEDVAVIGGYAVRFTGPDEPDLESNWFTPQTKMLLEYYREVPLLYQHGMDETLGRKVIGTARWVDVTDAGVWYEAQLNLRDEYERAILELVRQGALGYSTGSIAHLVDVAPDGELKAWPVVEVSLTPTPAAGPYLTKVAEVRSAYKAANLNFEEGTEMEENREDKVTFDLDAFKASLLDEVRQVMTETLASQATVKAAQASGDETITPVKAFDLWLHRRNDAVKALTEGTDSEGGYIVPDEYWGEVIKGLKDASLIRAAGARILTANSDVLRIPVMSGSSAAAITSESGSYSEADPSFSEVAVNLYKFTKLVKVSEELVADSMFDLWGEVRSWDLTQAFAAAENSYFTTGTGSGQPQGVVTGAGVGVTAASATAITADELIALYHSLNYLYRQGAVWMMHDSTAQAIRKLKDSNGQYLWQPGLRDGEPDILLGRPVITNNNMAEIATGNKTVLFGNFNYYAIVQRDGLTVDYNPYTYMSAGQVGYFGRMRLGGAVLLSEAFKVLQQA